MKARVRHFKGEKVKIIKAGLMSGNTGTCVRFDFTANFGAGRYEVVFENGIVGWYKRCEFEVLPDNYTVEV